MTKRYFLLIDDQVNSHGIYKNYHDARCAAMYLAKITRDPAKNPKNLASGDMRIKETHENLKIYGNMIYPIPIIEVKGLTDEELLSQYNAVINE